MLRKNSFAMLTLKELEVIQWKYCTKLVVLIIWGVEPTTIRGFANVGQLGGAFDHFEVQATSLFERDVLVVCMNLVLL